VSSAPSGIDSRAYVYGCKVVTTAGRSELNGWLVTRIQCFNNSVVTMAMRPANADIPILPGGCVTIEPNGAMRDGVAFAGIGIDGHFLALIEYWYPAPADGIQRAP